MIRFSDTTIIETKGEFSAVCEIMTRETANKKSWMLRSVATIGCEEVLTDCVLHFYSDGRVILSEIYRPLTPEIRNDDICELSQWCRVRGWQIPTLLARDLEDKRSYDFWHAQWEAGLIDSSVFSDAEKQYVNRLSEDEDAAKEKQ